jgi:NTE family protein
MLFGSGVKAPERRRRELTMATPVLAAELGQGVPRVDVSVELGALPLFRDLPPEHSRWLAEKVRIEALPALTTIFRVGDAGHELFVVVDGSVDILIPRAGHQELLATSGPGQWFGEMALLTREARSATARAATDVRLLVVSRSVFEELIARFPLLAVKLCDELSRRLRGRHTEHSHALAPRMIVLEDAAPSPAAMLAFDRLAQALAEESLGRIAVFDLLTERPDSPCLLSAGSRVKLQPAPQSIGEIARAVESHSLTLVHLDPRHRLADAVRRLPGAQVESDALFDVAIASSLNRRTASRLLTSPIRRLARRLLRRRVGIVLGAGGARGLCHIGVLRALERAGISLDLIVGTSIGGLVGGIAAMGADGDALLRAFRGVAADFRRLVVDVSFRPGTLLRGDKKRALLQSKTAGVDIADLTVPFRVVAADLVSAREVVMESGPLWQALDATTAIPTIFPPVSARNQRLVDGWIINPLPADVARREGADLLIGIDCCDFDEESQIGEAREPRFAGRFRLFEHGATRRMAMRAIHIGSRERSLSSHSLLDVCIVPPLTGFSTMDIRRIDEIVAVGEHAASEALPAIAEALDRSIPAVA